MSQIISEFSNMIARKPGFALIALLITAVTGCSSPAPRISDTHYNIETSIAPVSYGIATTIQLAKLDLRGIQSGRSLVLIYDTNPVQLREKRGHYWHSAPAHLLKRLISETLDKASQDIRFGTSANMQNPAYELEIDMRMFAFAPGKEAVVELEAVLKNQQNDIVMHYVLDRTVPLAGETPLAGVHGLQNALSQILTDLSTRLACHVTLSKISKFSKC